MTRQVKYQCCAPAPPPSPPTTTPPPTTPPAPVKCADTVVDGDETTCRSQEEWKRHAYEACLARNLILNDYGVGGGDCAPGKTHQVKYQCCAAATSTPGNSGSGGASGTGSTPGIGTPPSTGSGGACTGASEGSESSCKSSATWKQYATENCARQNLVLTDIGYGESCGTDLYRYMKYVCCTGK